MQSPVVLHGVFSAVHHGENGEMAGEKEKNKKGREKRFGIFENMIGLGEGAGDEATCCTPRRRSCCTPQSRFCINSRSRSSCTPRQQGLGEAMNIAAADERKGMSNFNGSHWFLEMSSLYPGPMTILSDRSRPSCFSRLVCQASPADLLGLSSLPAPHFVYSGKETDCLWPLH